MPQLVQPSSFPDHASYDEKVRRLYDDMDIHNSRAIDIEAFVSAFRRMNVGLSTTVVQELFARADANADKVISLSELQRFAEIFPTIVDCMYFRAKDYWTQAGQKREIDDTLKHLDNLQGVLGAARAESTKAEDVLFASDRRLQDELQGLGEAQSKELTAKDDLHKAHSETERGRTALREALAELHRCGDREKQRGLERAEAQRGVEHAARKVHQQELQVSAAEERLKELQRLVAEQEKEVDAQHRALDAQRSAWEVAQHTANEAERIEYEAKDVAESAGARAAEAERQASALQDAEWACGTALRALADDVARRMAARDTEQRTLSTHRETLRHKKHLEAQAVEAVEATQRQVSVLEQQHADFLSRREAADLEEQPLLEQEVRLRQQRDALENKERKLRTDFQQFTGRTTVRGLSQGRVEVNTGSPMRGVMPRLTYDSNARYQ